MPVEAFLLDLGRRLAMSLAGDLLGASRRAISRRFQDSEARKALDAALAEALTATLPDFTPASMIRTEKLR